ncbi:hypothetical protein [Arthrobacter sp. 4R501]|uniref:hypothetical protein n=1 Tax=Arthrobacter sp. 4R501 TaxID=2058886 RepID=UPI0011B080F8|nr:hypothetical protein [Arthrobacter sp. 4R501]
MERGNYRRVRRRGRAQPTERAIQKPAAVIGDSDRDGVSRKAAVVAPVSGFGLLRESLRKILNKGSGIR